MVERGGRKAGEEADDGERPLIAPLRALYAAGALLALGAAWMTFVLTPRVEDWFAWPITSSLTAATLGAAYLGAVALLGISARSRTWAEGRLAAPPVMAISLLLLAATLIHWGSFEHVRFVFWLWLAAYVLVPPVLATLVWLQLRAPGGDPDSTAPLPAWARGGLVVHAALLLGFGALLFSLPGTAQEIWPWALTDLTSQALGAFIFGFGVAAAFVIRDNERSRLGPPAIAYASLAGAALIALGRYAEEVDLGTPGALLYLAFLISALAGGLALWALGRSDAA